MFLMYWSTYGAVLLQTLVPFYMVLVSDPIKLSNPIMVIAKTLGQLLNASEEPTFEVLHELINKELIIQNKQQDHAMLATAFFAHT